MAIFSLYLTLLLCLIAAPARLCWGWIGGAPRHQRPLESSDSTSDATQHRPLVIRPLVQPRRVKPQPLLSGWRRLQRPVGLLRAESTHRHQQQPLGHRHACRSGPSSGRSVNCSELSRHWMPGGVISKLCYVQCCCLVA